VPRPRRVLRLLACVAVGLVLAAAVVGGLIRAGVIRNPFRPTLEGDVALARSTRPGLRVLFVGNSFTFFNSMPRLVHELAAADGRRVYAVSYTGPGWRLGRFVHDGRLARLLLDVHWDAVVLQEHSEIPSFSPADRERMMDPAARTLDAEIRGAASRTVLFMTWGYRHGDRRVVRDDTYGAMQARVAWNYDDLAQKLDAELAPVGTAWADALRRDPTLHLWAGDGRHPSRAGSYLAACVFLERLTGESPVGNAFTAGLPADETRLLQRAAAAVS
jgi:hypothetical protein